MARKFGRYRLDRLIGRGSVGEVWLARDTAADREVALKILTITAGEDPGYRQRFEREARVGASLRNPHIVPIHDFGEQDGRLFLDMAYVPGTDLSVRLRTGPIGVPEAVDIVSQIAEALDAAHAAGLVHRDVKPANIIVHSGGFAYLIDFGIARSPNQTTITATGFTIGTLAYMAPERFTGDAEPRSDIYSLACVLFECLTAQRPFGDTDPVQALHAHLSTDPPRPSSGNSAIPAALDAVIARGMAKKPEDRYSSAGELAAAARAAVGMPHPVPRTPPLPEQSTPGESPWTKTDSEQTTRVLSDNSAAQANTSGSPQPTRALPDSAAAQISPRPTRALPEHPGAQAYTPTQQPRPTRMLPGHPDAEVGSGRPPLNPTRMLPTGVGAPRQAPAPPQQQPRKQRSVGKIVAVLAVVALLGFALVAACTAVVLQGGGGQPNQGPAATAASTTAPNEPRTTQVPTTTPNGNTWPPPGFTLPFPTVFPSTFQIPFPTFPPPRGQ
ncbi:serine/threonine-protein kinase [Nocardia transvalensis]|uniref:non-specific serine/threonine protein kinase n=1 Tax=Nocardia transvalensis TaxID=37333 RepID=A0A7W9UJM1_9NOCA|nr:serine/threonine-protein kinase [Nocardia transvalensis]MBB5914835.1 serine/threonine-protein kinase [Nocardia transvalensis]